MRIVACVAVTAGSNPTGYFQLDDGRTIHEVSIPLLKAHGVLENADEVETFRGEFYREQAYSLQGVEAISTLSEGMIYRLIEGDGIIAGKEFDIDDFEVPEGVKFIGRAGFQGLTCLKRVIIPSSVETIEDDAFNGCVNLKEVKFSKGLKTIGHRAFANTGLCPENPLVIPDTVENISMKNPFPASAKYVFISYDMNSNCRRALTRCGLQLRSSSRYGY